MSLYKSFFSELQEADSERVAREAPAAIKAGDAKFNQLHYHTPQAYAKGGKPLRDRAWRLLWALDGLENKMKEKKPNLPERAEQVNAILERNIPTSPDKWAKAKAAARAKFKVYPSAYANLWAAKKYKSMGGGWKKGKK